MGWWILLGAVILVVLWLVFTYNGLITARNRTQEAWSEIDVELKRRHDLIPNLVNTVSGYMGNVPDYESKLQTLPTSLIAGALGFKPFGFFQADEGDRAVPQVNFGNMPAPGSLPPPAAGPSGPPGPGSAGPPPQS